MADVQGQKKSGKKQLEKTHECPLCCKMFSRQYVLEQHMMISHDGEKPHKCSVCGKGYTTSQGLNYHMRTHTGEKPHKCLVCNKGFPTSGNLKTHMLIHTGEKPYKCPICNKSFRRQSYEHMMSHTGEKRHKCSLCAKGFVTGAKLKRHMMSHSGEKPHECPVCTRRFAQKGHLKDHMKTHSPQKLHQGSIHRCSICSQTFSFYGDLSKHMLHHMLTHMQTRTQNTHENRKTDKDSSGLEQNTVTYADQILYVCSFCDRQFDTMTAAGMRDACNHLDTHKEEKVQPGLSTQQNSETAYRNDKEMVTLAIEEHEMTQDDQILYACCFCEKQFDTTTPEGMVDACDHLDTHKEDKVESSSSEQQDSEVGDGNDNEMATCTAVTNADDKGKPTQGSPEDNVQSRVSTPSVETNLVPISEPVRSKKVTRPAYLEQCTQFKAPHMCFICYKQFTQASFLEVHMLSHKGDTDEDLSGLEQHTTTHMEGKSHKCTYCNRDFSTKSALEEHEITHTDRIQYACSLCSKQFDTMLDACNHMVSHQEEILEPISSLQQKPQEGDGDDKEIMTNTAVTSVDEKGRTIQGFLYDSTQSKIPTPAVATTTDEEDKNNDSFIGLEIGTRGVLSNAETDKEKEMFTIMNKQIKTEDHQCSICEQQFVNLAILKQHMSTIHATENIHKTPHRLKVYHECSVCNKTFLEASYLEKHIMLKHNRPRPHNSSQCRKTNEHLSSLEQHTMIPTKGNSRKSALHTMQLSTDKSMQQSSGEHNCLQGAENDAGSCNLITEKDTALELIDDNPGAALEQEGGLVRPHKTQQEAQDVNKPYKCSKCTAQFVDMSNFVSHMLSHRGLKDNKCPLCSFGSRNLTSLKMHISKVHSKDKQDTSVSVVKIEKQEPEPTLHMPMDTAHVEEGPNACIFCGEEFESKSAASKHMIDTGGSCKKCNLVRRCVLCSKQFTSLICLKAHMMTHAGEQLYKCSLCKLAFILKTEHDRHMVTHKGTFKCYFCGEVFTKVEDLQRHTMTHPAKKHKCSHCNRVFMLKTELDKHMVTHTGEKIHKCTMCRKGYAVLENLEKHKMTHVNAVEKAHKCPHCDLEFSTQSALNEHMVTHTEKTLHACSICNKQFGTMLDICTHMHTHKEDRPEPSSFLEKELQLQRQKTELMTIKAETNTEKKGFAQATEEKSNVKIDDVISFLDFCRNKNSRDVPHICVLCGVEFDTWEAVTKHLQVHNVEQA